jgi:uncharacterized protein DUF6600
MARRAMAALLVFLLLVGSSSAVRAQAPPPPGAAPAAPADAIGATPPRLGYAQGPVSFWRPGAADWAAAQINTPLAPGDELYSGHEGLAELQVGGRAFVRAWGDTQLGLANQEPDFLQLKVTGGHATLDLRGVDPGRTVEIDTPHAAFSIDSPGYYRVDVSPEQTQFITRRGGRAGMTTPGGQPMAIAASEEIVVEAAPAPSVRSFAAPDLDVFDRWNYTRTDELIESASARYVPSQVYGVDDLDHYGAWRVVPTYGSIWVPQAVPAGWAPYSTGRWIWDPSYGWTWVDTAPWGWAPYHYGRWVSVDGYWAWAPGPLVARPVYAPALVAFFSAPGVSVSIGAPFVSWVALGWGEPVVPWWGRPGYVGHAHWLGWGGPRVVNNVVINRTTVVNVQNITVYRNATVNNAVVAVQRDGFGRRPVREARVEHVDVRQLTPVHGRLDVKPTPVSFVASSGAPAVRPPEAVIERPVVATRPHARRETAAVPPAEGGAPAAAPAPVKVPAPKIVPAPKAVQSAPVPARPPLGTSNIERSQRPEPQRLEASPRPQSGPAVATPPGEDRTRRPEPPPAQGRPDTRAETPGARERGAERATPPGRGPAVVAPPAVVTPPPRPEPAPPVGRPPQPQHEQGRDRDRPLPGEPANKVFPGRSEIAPRHPQAVPAVSQHATTPAPQRGAFSPDTRVSGGHAADARVSAGRTAARPAAAPRPAASRDNEHEARKDPRR